MDTDKLVRPRVAVDRMNDGKGELPLCEVLTKTLVLCILFREMRMDNRYMLGIFPKLPLFSSSLPQNTEGYSNHHEFGSRGPNSPRVGRNH